MNKSLHFLAAAALIGGGCWVASAWGQQRALPGAPAEQIRRSAEESEPQPVPDDHRPMLPHNVDSFEAPTLGPDVLIRRGPSPEPEQIDERQAIHEVVERFRSAKEGPEKDGAKKALVHVLDQSFTRDLERREREVSDIEARVHKLREQIERRKKAKDEIVGLRLKTIINETEGLGFPGPQEFGLPRKRRVRLENPADIFSPRPQAEPPAHKPVPPNEPTT